MSGPVEPAPEAEDDHAAFDYDGGGHRLRRRTRWAAFCVALGTALPYEVVAGRPQYLWDLADELPLAGVIAVCAPAVAGAIIALAGWRTRRAGSLGWIVLATLVGMRLVIDVGADAAAWGALGLPESVTARQGWALLALGATAAGATLTFKPHARRAGRGLLIGGVLIAIAFFGWPGRGEAPIRTIIRAAGSIGDLPDVRYQLGLVVIGVMALWPALVAAVGLLHIKQPARDGHPLIALAAIYGLPLLIAMLVFRSVPTGSDGWSIFVPIGTIAVVAATVALLASAFEAAVEATFAPPPDVQPPPGWPPRRTALAAAVTVAVTVGVVALLARPPDKGVEWPLGPRTPAAEALFVERLPAWNRARLVWDRSARRASGASRLLEVKAVGREMVEAAREIDEGLADALAQMVAESRDLHVAGRTWYRLVAGVNEASRRAGLPYYLDPTVFTFQTTEGPGRHFRMRTFAVERVRRFDVGGRAFATLHVRRIDVPDAGSRLLGFSRDVQRFALVDVDEARDFETSLAESALREPPVCDDIEVSEAGPGLTRCGAVLAELLRTLPDGLIPAIVATTDRHELQHQIDGPHLPLSSAVLERLGGRSPRLLERVNRELSAYVAELTAPDAPPAVGLIHMVRFALQGGGHLHHVAMIALEAMVDRPLDDGAGGPDHRAVADAFAELSGLPDEKIRARAADAWHALFGQPLAPVASLD